MQRVDVQVLWGEVCSLGSLADNPLWYGLGWCVPRPEFFDQTVRKVDGRPDKEYDEQHENDDGPKGQEPGPRGLLNELLEPINELFNNRFHTPKHTPSGQLPAVKMARRRANGIGR